MIADVNFWMPLAIAVPLLAAIGAFLLPRRSFHVALIGSVATTAVVIVMIVLLMEQNSAARHTIGGWGAPLGIDLVLDGFSALMLLLTAVIGLAITSHAHGYFLPKHDNTEDWHQYNYFWPLWLLLWTALNALFLSGDLFNLYVTLELLGFSAVALTALVRKPAVLKAAMRYLLVSLSGSLMYLLGVVFLYGNYGALDIALLGTLASDTPALIAAASLITVGLVMKTALFPFHFWLPPAHANAAAPVSALLSALVVKGSFYILLRLWLTALHPLGETFVPQILSALGAAAIVWGSVQAMRQTQLKMLVAYSTVAQLGYLFLLMPLLLRERESVAVLAGIVFFLMAHALAKAAAFLSAGNMLYAVGEDRIASLDGLTARIPITLASFGVAGVSLTALPPSGGFMAKWLMLNAALEHGQWWLAFMIIIGGLLAAIYIVKVMAHLFYQAEGPKGDEVRSVPTCMAWPPFGLAILAILLGFTGAYLLEMLAVGAPWALEVAR